MRSRCAGSAAPLLAALVDRGSAPITADRMAVVVAHPDDETIGCGALLGRLLGVTLVLVTDGAPRNLVDARAAGFTSAAGYARARARELAAALAFAGRPEIGVIRLGVPDQEAALHLPEVSRGLALLLGRLRIETVLTHAYEGGHPDHDATAFAVHAARRLLARTDRWLSILEMPFYRLGPCGMLVQDFTAGGGSPVLLELSQAERHRKAAMMAAYVSQRSALAGFAAEMELFRPAPDYDFSELPNEGRLLYECHDWGMTGGRWRRLVRAALGELGLRRRDGPDGSRVPSRQPAKEPARWISGAASMRPDLEAMRPALRDSVLRCARGELPPNVALARLVSAARSRQELETALLQGAAACDAERPDGGAALRLAHALWTGTPQAWSVLRDVAATAGRWRPAPDVDSAIARWSALFDRAAELSPDASVALYSLGRVDLLAAATEEIVAFARDRNLLGRDKAVVEIGCGNGRCLAALADAVRFVVGLDVSRQMLVQARRRCAALGNVGLVHSAGRDLSVLRDGCADLVIAVDSFPYLCAVGAEVAARHVAEARRVLRTGGSLLILNYSYRDNLEADAAELLRLANANGFALAIAGDRPFRHWDGAAFLLRG